MHGMCIEIKVAQQAKIYNYKKHQAEVTENERSHLA